MEDWLFPFPVRTICSVGCCLLTQVRDQTPGSLQAIVWEVCEEVDKGGQHLVPGLKPFPELGLLPGAGTVRRGGRFLVMLLWLFEQTQISGGSLVAGNW